MFLNSWSIALTVLTICVLLMGGRALITGTRVLRFWDSDSDSSQQIQLENEIWLTSTLVQYAVGFQIFSLFLLVLAAENFSTVIKGAMCATGSFLANDYGLYALGIKLAGVFLYGYWIVLHRLDVSSEQYPLVKTKYIYLFGLLPVFVTDAVLQTLYFANLSPDIITSCFGVVFSGSTAVEQNLLGLFSSPKLLLIFYGLAALIAGTGVFFLWKFVSERSLGKMQVITSVFYSMLWSGYFIIALLVITVVVSSYIYAMPYHHCPFCILKPEYNYIGYALFLPLIGAAFLGTSCGLVSCWFKLKSLKETITRFQRRAVWTSLVLLLFFVLLASFHYCQYQFFGGEF